MPGFHRSVAVLPLPSRRSAAVKFRCSVKLRKQIPFHYSRKRQKAAVSVLPLKYDRVSLFPLPLFRSWPANRRRRRAKAYGSGNGNGDGYAETATANGNSEMATEERQRNGGNQALCLVSTIPLPFFRCRFAVLPL